MMNKDPKLWLTNHARLYYSVCIYYYGRLIYFLAFGTQNHTTAVPMHAAAKTTMRKLLLLIIIKAEMDTIIHIRTVEYIF